MRTRQKASPDGYTLLMATTGVMAINSAMYKNLSYDADKDLKPVIYIASITNADRAGGFAPQERGRRHRGGEGSAGKLSFAWGGCINPHVRRAVPADDWHRAAPHSLQRQGQAMPDVISGRVSMMFENMPGAVGHIKAGKEVLAVTGLQRTPALPDVKTVAESGVPGYESLSWSGIAAPAATPPEVIARLNKEINAILTSPDMRQKLTEQGAEAVEARRKRSGSTSAGSGRSGRRWYEKPRSW